MTRNPADRFPDAGAALLPVLDETRAALATTQLAMDPPVAPASPPPRSAAVTASSLTGLWVVGGGALVVAVLGLGTAAWFFAPRPFGAANGSAAVTPQPNVEPAAENGLSAQQIEAVVARNMAAVRARCWRPGRSERVRVKLTIARTGSVMGAAAEDPRLPPRPSSNASSVE